MKVLHVASFNSAAQNIGVVRQMGYELNAVKNSSLDWHVELWASDGVEGFDFIKPYPVSSTGWFKRRKVFFDRLREASKIYDAILVRYVPVDLFLPFFRSKSSKIFLVHHTKEDSALKVAYPGLKGRLFAWVELILGFFSIRHGDGLIAVTPEIAEYEEKRCLKKHKYKYIYPNGIGYDDYAVADDERSGKIKIIFTASKFFSWHGLSEVLNSLQSYDNKSEIELHLVGNVSEEDKNQISTNCMREVIMHGYLDDGRLRALLSSIDLALASFGLGSKGMKQACTLKVREYLAAGIPVYSGHDDVAFVTDFEYFRKGPIDFNLIYEYAKQSRLLPRKTVRDAAEEFIEKKHLVKSLYNWLIKEINKT